MSRRTVYTLITPLPSNVTRDSAVELLHSHEEIIKLDPAVVEYYASCPDSRATPDETLCSWYRMTDRISYFPGIKSRLSYSTCFHNLPRGLQSHLYASAGLEVKKKWAVAGNEPGEEKEVAEIGLPGAPREGLYIREDVDLRCNFLTASTVKKNIRLAHGMLVKRMVAKAGSSDSSNKTRSPYGHHSKAGRSAMPRNHCPSPMTAQDQGQVATSSPRSDVSLLGKRNEVDSWGNPALTVGSSRTSTRSSSIGHMEGRAVTSWAGPASRNGYYNPHAHPVAPIRRLSMALEPFDVATSVGHIAELPGESVEAGAFKSTSRPDQRSRRDSSTVADKAGGSTRLDGFVYTTTFELE